MASALQLRKITENLARFHSDNQEVPRHLWNPKVQCRIYISPPLCHTFSRRNKTESSFNDICSNISLSFMLRSFDVPLPFKHTNKNVFYTSHLFTYIQSDISFIYSQILKCCVLPDLW